MKRNEYIQMNKMEISENNNKKKNIMQKLVDVDLGMLITPIPMGFYLTYVIREYSIVFAQIVFIISMIYVVIGIGVVASKYKINTTIASMIGLFIVFGLYAIMWF